MHLLIDQLPAITTGLRDLEMRKLLTCVAQVIRNGITHSALIGLLIASAIEPVLRVMFLGLLTQHFSLFISFVGYVFYFAR